jgi:hypothetical protein
MLILLPFKDMPDTSDAIPTHSRLFHHDLDARKAHKHPTSPVTSSALGPTSSADNKRRIIGAKNCTVKAMTGGKKTTICVKAMRSCASALALVKRERGV